MSELPFNFQVSLRGRIAMVLSDGFYAQPYFHLDDWCDAMADAVIDDLKLTVTNGVIVGCLHE